MSLLPITIEEQIACVQREIGFRRRVYQRWVKAQEQLQIRLRASSTSSGVVVPAKVASARALVAEYEKSLLLLCVIDFERYALVVDFVQWFWDNAASMSIVNDVSCLIEVVKLTVPFAIGGVNSGWLPIVGFSRFYRVQLGWHILQLMRVLIYYHWGLYSLKVALTRQ